jgi:hypothetical protein
LSVVTASLVLGVAAAATAAEDRLDDLDATMDVFDDVGEVPSAMADLPVPRVLDDGLVEDELARGDGRMAGAVPDESSDDAGNFDDVRDPKREIAREYRRDLAADVGERFVVAGEFEDGGRAEPPLGEHEDDFHEEAGEDVDVEDGFNDVEEPETDEGVE